MSYLRSFNKFPFKMEELHQVQVEQVYLYDVFGNREPNYIYQMYPVEPAIFCICLSAMLGMQ